MPLQDELANKQIEVLLDIHTKRLHAELAQLREELSRTKEELLKELKEVRSVRQDTPSPQAIPQPAASTPVQPVAQPTAVQEAAPSADPIDRNGVAPADVSIEKIFYMGK